MAAHGLAKTAEIGGETSRVRRRMRPRALRSTDVAHDSPAAALQAHLAQTWSDAPTDETKWSARRSLAFVVVVNGGFWLGLSVAVASLIKAAH
jgi:hypothetical protein